MPTVLSEVPPNIEATDHNTTPIRVAIKSAGANALTIPIIKTRPAINCVRREIPISIDFSELSINEFVAGSTRSAGCKPPARRKRSKTHGSAAIVSSAENLPRAIASYESGRATYTVAPTKRARLLKKAPHRRHIPKKPINKEPTIIQV